VSAWLTLRADRLPSRPLDVQILLIDTLRADRLPIYGYGRSTAPNLTSFAKSAVVFDNTWATASWTLPSTASVLTGTYPSVHGVRAKNGDKPSVFTVRQRVETFAEAMHQAGYYNIALIANFWLAGEHGIDRGFDHYQIMGKATAEELNARARELLEKVPADQPVFLYLHYLDVHAPYHGYDVELEPMDPKFTERRLAPYEWGRSKQLIKGFKSDTPPMLSVFIDAYDKAIYGWDRQFGAWVQWLGETGRLDRTAIAVTADHGEEFLDHGRWAHGNSLYQEQLWVPWILRVPGLQPARVETPSSIADIAPTILTLLGEEVPETMLGVAQVRSGMARLAEVDPDRSVFAELNADGGGNWGNSEMQAARRRDTKVVRRNRNYDGYQSFDLAADPNERLDTPASPELVELLDDLAAKYQDIGEGLGRPGNVEMSDDLKERLRSLGYDFE